MDKAKSCGHFPTGSNVDNFWQFVRKAEYKGVINIMNRLYYCYFLFKI